jgi:GR25 family glycosyltransferase involved in LPS biosynthesis
MSQADQKSSELLAIILTCKSSPAARVASARLALTSLDLPVEIKVVEGFVGEDDHVDRLYDVKSNRRWVKRPISRTEVAVYATHRLAWEHLQDSQRQAIIVFEDDFAIRDPETVATVIRSWKEMLGDGRDIVKLFDFEKKAKNRPVFTTEVNGVELVKWASPSAGMVAYLISRKGAQKFLMRERVFRQVDEDTKYFWELGLNIWSVPGNPVAEISHELGGSLVEADRQSIRERRLMRSLWGILLTLYRKARTWISLFLERF